MICIKTDSGFECELDESALDDMEIIDDLAAIDGGNPLPLSRVLVKIIGDENRKRLYDLLRTEDGRVPIEAVSTEIGNIIKALGESKKK